MAETTPHTIELAVAKTRVTFGKRLTGGDLMRLDEDPQSDIPTQHQLLILRAGITGFGSLPIPVPLTTLLALDSVDIDDLVTAANAFDERGLDGRAPEFVSDSEVRLAIGFESNGLVYNHVRFGRRVTGNDLVAADKKGFKGLRRECFLMGREIASLETNAGGHSLDGPVEMQVFEQLDGGDIVTLRQASQIWRDSFRRSGGAVQVEVGAERPAAGGADRLEQK